VNVQALQDPAIYIGLVSFAFSQGFNAGGFVAKAL